ncbi:MAG: hypothetical protein RJA81_1271, partial [Planctomycetota bacterium]
MSSSLKEDLASLKIDRNRSRSSTYQPKPKEQEQQAGHVSYKPVRGRVVR